MDTPPRIRGAVGRRDHTTHVQPETSDDFGATLRVAREAAGRSLRDVAEVTKLAVRTLEALERNQIERLPSGIFRRAIVRAYAKDIGLDPEETLKAFLARYPDALPPPGAGAAAIVDAAPSSGSRMLAVIATGVVVAIVVLLVVAGYLLWPRVGVGLVLSPPSAGARAASPSGPPLPLLR